MKKRFSEPEIVKNFKFSKFPNLKSLTLLLYSLATITSFYQSNHTQEGSVALWLIVGYFTTSLLVAIIFLLQRYFSRIYGDRIPIKKVYIIGASLGAFKGISTYSMLNYFLHKDSFPWDELFLEGYSKGFMGIGLAFLFSLRASYVSEIDTLEKYHKSDNDYLVDEISFLTSEISSLKAKTRQQVIERLVKDRDLWKKIDLYSSNPQENSEKISEALRGDITEQLRNRSHRLTRPSTSPQNTKQKIKESLQLKNWNIHPRVFALIQLSIGASISYQDWNPRDSFWNLIVNSIIVYFVANAFKKIQENDAPNSPQSNWSALVLMTTTIITLFVMAQYAIRGAMWAENPLIFLVSVILWEIFLLLVISTVSELITFHDSISKLEAEVGQDLNDKIRILNENYDVVRRDLGKHIHGFLINKIQVTAGELDKLASQGKFDEYKTMLTELFEEFSLGSIEAKMNFQELTPDFIETLKQSWDGLLSIEVEIDEHVYIGLHKSQALEIGRVLEEMIGNSFRHGKATRIDISISQVDERRFEILGRDNGQGVLGEPKPGLGSHLFDMSSDGDWSLANCENGGAQVTLNVTRYQPESEIL